MLGSTTSRTTSWEPPETTRRVSVAPCEDAGRLSAFIMSSICPGVIAAGRAIDF
jgi:hypothetical protein